MHAFVGKRERAVLEYTISELITKTYPPRDYLGGWGFGLWFLALCVAIRSYCAASRALSGLYLMPFLCHSTKKGRKKGNLDVPSKTSLGSRRGVAASGCLCRQALGKGFCCPVFV